MPQPSDRSLLGIAKEVTPGSPVASTFFIPVKTAKPSDNLMYLPDSGMRGSMVKTYGEVQGVASSTFDFGGDVFPDAIGFPLAGVLGDVATSGVAAPYTHVIGVLNSGDGQPTSYTVDDQYVAGNRQYAGCKFSDVGFKFTSEGLLTYDAKAVGYASAVATAPTASFTSSSPLANWVGTVTIGGVASLAVFDGELSIKRPVSAIHTVQNSQAPYKVFAGPVEVSGKLHFVMESDAELVRYLTNSQPSLSFDFAQGSGVEVKFAMSKVAYTNAAIARDKDYIGLECDFTAIANSTDVGTSAGFSPIKATLKNALAAATYV